LLLENGGQDGQNAQQPTSGLAQAGGDVWIEKVVQKCRRCAKPPSRCVQARKLCQKSNRIENGVQPENAVKNVQKNEFINIFESKINFKNKWKTEN